MSEEALALLHRLVKISFESKFHRLYVTLGIDSVVAIGSADKLYESCNQ